MEQIYAHYASGKKQFKRHKVNITKLINNNKHKRTYG